jgi:hypothetical protein
MDSATKKYSKDPRFVCNIHTHSLSTANLPPAEETRKQEVSNNAKAWAWCP